MCGGGGGEESVCRSFQARKGSGRMTPPSGKLIQFERVDWPIESISVQSATVTSICVHLLVDSVDQREKKFVDANRRPSPY